MIRLALIATLLLVACPRPPAVRYVTSHGVEVVGIGAPTQAEVERWTVEAAQAIGRADCPELAAWSADEALRVLRYSRDQGVGARATFVAELDAYGYASGRWITVGPLQRAASYRHELTHALLYALAPAIPASQHHQLMTRCGL